MNKLFKKSVMASLAVVTVTSYLGADGGGFGGGFAAGAFTGATVGIIASNAGRERSPEYYEQKTIQQRNKTIDSQIRKNDRQINKNTRAIDRINKNSKLDDATKAKQIKPLTDAIEKLEAKNADLTSQLE